MQVDLRKLQTGVGAEPLTFSQHVDLSDLRLWGKRPLERPVSVSGSVREASGIVTLSYTAAFTVGLLCDRCLRPLERREEWSFVHTLAQQVENEDKNDTLIVVPGGTLDLVELVREDLCLSLAPVVLCKEDCRGLCPVCGRDRNDGACGCGADA